MRNRYFCCSLHRVGEQSDPEILLLDEPTNNLDINSIRWLEDVLNQRASTMVRADACGLANTDPKRFADQLDRFLTRL